MKGAMIDKFYHPEYELSKEDIRKIEETVKKDPESIQNLSDMNERIDEFYRKHEEGYNKYFDIVEDFISKHKGLNEEIINEEIKQILVCPDDNYGFVNVLSYLHEAIEKGDKRVSNQYKQLFYNQIENLFGIERAIKLAMGLEGIDEFYYEPSEFKQLINDLSYMAKSNDPIMIVGETGTGKELIARVIHTISKRRKEPFIEVNCAAIPENLLESELFGVVPGYPGFQSPKGLPGLIESAKNGTIFLDELGKTTKNIQSKILTVVEENKFSSLGSGTFKHVNVRFIAAVQPQDLENNILTDLKYRFGFPDVIKLKSLNEKLILFGKEVVSVVFTRTLQKMDIDHNSMNLDTSCLEILLNHKYEGNYRELGNILRAAIRSALIDERQIIEAGDFRNILQHNKLALINKMETPGASTFDYSDIKLKDIISYTNKMKSAMIGNKIVNVYKTNNDLKSVYLSEGMPEKGYQNFCKLITKATGKSLRELKKMAKAKPTA